MRISPRKIHLLLGATVALSAVVAPAAQATTPAPPTNVHVTFHDSSATISWTMAPGVEGYGITIREIGTKSRYGEEQVLGDRWDAPFTVFPDYAKYKDGYAFRVCSIGDHAEHACTSVRDPFDVNAVGDDVSTSDLDKAAHKVTSCLKSGAEAGLVTASGGGLVAAMVSWIPMVDAVTASEVGVAVAKASAGKFVTCLVG